MNNREGYGLPCQGCLEVLVPVDKPLEADGKRYCNACTGAVVGYRKKGTTAVFCPDPVCLYKAMLHGPELPDAVFVPIPFEEATALRCWMCNTPLGAAE